MFANLFSSQSKPYWAVLAGGTAAWLAFLHQMQNNASFAEFMGNISPEVANRFSCSCPFCTRTPACSIPADQIGLHRLDLVNLETLLKK